MSAALASFSNRLVDATFPELTLVDPQLLNGRVHSYFAGVQHRLTNALVLEVNGTGSFGRRLVTTDLVNRDFTLATGRINPKLPDINYRSSEGFSNYNALTAVARYRSSRGALQLAYTWSHVIDNQSEAFTGDFSSLSPTYLIDKVFFNPSASFSRQFDPHADRGNSDFDQRHNLVLFSWWELPSPRVPKLARLLGGWQVSGLAGFRSGFPYNLIGPTNAMPGKGVVVNNRPDLINPSAAQVAQPVAGGQLLLSKPAFAPAGASALGTLGRNAFTGPGFYNVDFSVSRTIALRPLGEAARLNLRADAYNVLNHVNLGNPISNYGHPAFGIAQYGRSGIGSDFLAAAPLIETPRRLQVSVRVTF